jgi:hypothetical protein
MASARHVIGKRTVAAASTMDFALSCNASIVSQLFSLQGQLLNSGMTSPAKRSMDSGVRKVNTK